jgi:hypothetical protein
MDAHFNEYLAAVAGMQELYGDGGEDRPTEFHHDCVAADVIVAAASVATA